MKVSEMRIGGRYRSTAFKQRVRLIAIEKVDQEGYGLVTVEYHGKLYTDCTFRMSI